MSAPAKPQNPFATVGGIIGAVGGWALSHYTGPALWIPGFATLLLFLLFTKTPLRPKYFLGAIVITGGHVVWFVVASVIAQVWALTALDIVVLTVGLVWLWVRPSLAAALFLGVVQLGSLAYSGYLISAQPFGSPAHKALTVHCLWRLLALIALVVGYLRMRRERLTGEDTAG